MRFETILMVATLLMGGASAQDGKQAPKKLSSPAEWGIGKAVADFTCATAEGKDCTLADLLKDRKALVLAFTAVDCPVSKLYRPKLERMGKNYRDRGVAFAFVDCVPTDKPETSGAPFPILHDKDGTLAARLKATRTTDAFVIDAGKVLRYRGAIDDQYGIGYNRETSTENYLTDALDAILNGKEVTVKATEAPGCPIEKKDSGKPTDISFNKDIAPILQNRCQACHRPGEIGPFPLLTYDQVRKNGKSIRAAVTSRRMPPWYASPKHLEIANEKRLTDAEVALIQNWVDAGMPQGSGNPPKPKEFVAGWQIGKPDLILKVPPYKVRAEGAIPYRYETIDPKLKEDVWVQAIEVRPGARPVVHHILVFNGRSELQFQQGLNGYFGSMVPGEDPMMLPDGQAKRLKAGEKLTVQIHYNANGKEYTDETQIGFKFAKKPVTKEIHTRAASSIAIDIPPGAEDHVVTGTHRLGKDSMLLSFQAHTHVRGKSFRYEAVYPDATTEILLDIPNYDFNWQQIYKLKKPKLLPAGTRIKVTAHYDNSAKNPANPDPKARVNFGDQTWDEMLIGYFDYYEGKD